MRTLHNQTHARSCPVCSKRISVRRWCLSIVTQTSCMRARDVRRTSRCYLHILGQRLAWLWLVQKCSLYIVEVGLIFLIILLCLETLSKCVSICVVHARIVSRPDNSRVSDDVWWLFDSRSRERSTCHSSGQRALARKIECKFGQAQGSLATEKTRFWPPALPISKWATTCLLALSATASAIAGRADLLLLLLPACVMCDGRPRNHRSADSNALERLRASERERLCDC